jgi:hypothetical protein
MLPPYSILLLIFAVSILLTVIYRLEKKMVWPYGEPEPLPRHGDPSGYGERWVKEAGAAGYRLLGWAPDIKGPTYRVSYAMMISPEQDTIAIVGVGTVMNINLSGTWLHTPDVEGRSYFSTDNPAGLQMDISGNWKNQFAPQTTFQGLLKKHRDWLTSLSVTPRSFSKGNELAEFKSLREQHFHFMERAGLIRFTNGAATHFHFTWLGAARTATWAYFSGMARRVTFGRFPRTA